MRVAEVSDHSHLDAMLLNRVEKAMMNNPLRAALQRGFETSRLLAMGGAMNGGFALEIGCGRGIGTELILDRFGADRVDAFDIDPEMVEQARDRLEERGTRARIWIGDAAAIDAPDDAYDAVFDFGILHHVPHWRGALSEIHRVLRPGGRFYAEEVLISFIHNPLWRRLLDHPMDDRFDAEGFRRGLEGVGLEVIDARALFSQFAWFVAEKPYAM